MSRTARSKKRNEKTKKKSQNHKTRKKKNTNTHAYDLNHEAS